MAVDSFAGKLAVVTGGGAGMGRELVRQLAAQGCSVAACDLNADAVAVTAATAWAAAPPGVQVTGHACDVSDEAQVLRFRDELLAEHASGHVDLVFSNAGIGGGGSFVNGSRQEWERTFAVDWQGVYYCARVFLPLLIASGDGILVNTSSLNGLWATLGPGMPNTAYSTAKFAVRGFTEALIEDLRTNAPQVRVAVVLPGSVGTDILDNTRRAHGLPGPEDLSDEQTEEARDFLVTAKLVAPDASPGEVRKTLVRLEKEGKDKRRSARPRRPPSSSMACARGRGGSSLARTSHSSTSGYAAGPSPPTTTPRCSKTCRPTFCRACGTCRKGSGISCPNGSRISCRTTTSPYRA